MMFKALRHNNPHRKTSVVDEHSPYAYLAPTLRADTKRGRNRNLRRYGRAVIAAAVTGNDNA